MKSLKSLVCTFALVVSGTAFAQKANTVDPDILPALPSGPPKAASKTEVASAKVELKGACTISLKKGEGLAADIKIKDKNKVSAICECVSREVAKGASLEEMDFLTTFYKGFDDKLSENESGNIYLHEGQKLEENCRLDSNYKVGQPEPRERQVNSVPETPAKKSK